MSVLSYSTTKSANNPAIASILIFLGFNEGRERHYDFLTLKFMKIFLLFLIYFIFKLYIIVLVLPNIKMNPPQVYMCSPS